jgi:tetratricopeptide (TPR) repeat protein
VIREEIGDRAGLGGLLNSIGVVYLEKGSLDQALEYFERSKAIREKMGARAGLAWVLNNIGIIYEKQKKLIEAEQVYAQVVTIFEEVGSPDLNAARRQLEKVRELQRSTSKNES